MSDTDLAKIDMGTAERLMHLERDVEALAAGLHMAGGLLMQISNMVGQVGADKRRAETAEHVASLGADLPEWFTPAPVDTTGPEVPTVVHHQATPLAELRDSLTTFEASLAEMRRMVDEALAEADVR